ncbi:mannose-6-phosphate isomerase [Escherichia coli]|uniref:Phosphohexomutase n=1 Tax=Escherichia coli TaxID=562 RepID=A0A376KTJ8_ECOLX|nr:mannose-6-phosphate isomerase [Escherichia coli]
MILPSRWHDLSDKETTISQQSAAILFCVEGDVTLWKGSQQLQLKPGESAFIAANESPVTVKGHGRFSACLQQAVRAYWKKLTSLAKLIKGL